MFVSENGKYILSFQIQYIYINNADLIIYVILYFANMNKYADFV